MERRLLSTKKIKRRTFEERPKAPFSRGPWERLQKPKPFEKIITHGKTRCPTGAHPVPPKGGPCLPGPHSPRFKAVREKKIPPRPRNPSKFAFGPKDLNYLRAFFPVKIHGFGRGAKRNSPVSQCGGKKNFFKADFEFPLVFAPQKVKLWFPK